MNLSSNPLSLPMMPCVLERAVQTRWLILRRIRLHSGRGSPASIRVEDERSVCYIPFGNPMRNQCKITSIRPSESLRISIEEKGNIPLCPWDTSQNSGAFPAALTLISLSPIMKINKLQGIFKFYVGNKTVLKI